MWTTNRVQAAPGHGLEAPSRARRAPGGRRSTPASRMRRPARRARRTPSPRRPSASRSELGLRPEEVIVLSTGVIGAAAADGQGARRRRAAAAGELSAEGGDAAAERDPDDGLRAEDRGRRPGRGFTVGGMAKGAGMIHPAPRDDARRRHDRLPARRRARRTTFLRPAVERELQPDLGRRRLLDERRGGPARQRRRAEPPVTTRPRSPTALGDGVCAISPGRSSPTARARPSCSRSGSPAPPRRRRRRRSRAGSRRRRSSRRPPSATIPNWGRVLAGRRLGAVRTAASRDLDTDRLTVAFDGVAGLRGRRRRPAPCRSSRAPSCRIDLDLGLGDGEAVVSRLRPLDRLRADQRGVHDVSGAVVLKLGGRVAAGAVARGARPADRRTRRRRRPRSRAADHGRDGAARDRARLRRRPARDDARGARRRPRVARRRERRASARAIGPRALGALRGRDRPPGATGRGARASSAIRRPRRRPRSSSALAAGRIPVVAPLAAGPLNVNADEAAAALAVGLRASRILFVTRRPRRADRRRAGDRAFAADDADRMLADGTLRGRHRAEAEAAVRAARGGVRASIGATEVAA